MHERSLSSAYTFWFKFVLPAGWIFGFGFGAIQLWFGVLHDRNNAMPPPEMKFVFAGIWILGSVFSLWAGAALKRVRIGEGRLHISNYVREICVPFSAIMDVQQNRWINFRPITIYFRDATEFGDKATFMPKPRFSFKFWRVDPVVDELRQLAGLPDA
jgi:hypothetical protein